MTEEPIQSHQTNQLHQTEQSAARSHIRAEDVKYLVFEGGGGKGFAFVGAVEELERRGIIENALSATTTRPAEVVSRPVGVAGSSAGAITALMIAMGMTASEIQQILGGKLETVHGHTISGNFEIFFDGPQLFNAVGAEGRITSDEAVSAWIDDHADTLKRFMRWHGLLEDFVDGIIKSISGSDRRPTRKFYQKNSIGERERIAITVRHLDKVLAPKSLKNNCKTEDSKSGGESKTEAGDSKTGGFLQQVASLAGVSSKKYNEYLCLGAIKSLRKNLATGIISLLTEGGVYPGLSAFSWLDDLISIRIEERTGSKPARHVTFFTFFQVFGCDLAITGTNVATGKSEIFSKLTTPQLPVATAVRISMGLPFLFKPVRITYKDYQKLTAVNKFHGGPVGTMGPEQLVGTWVDGGVLNNLPIGAFEAMGHSAAARHTLGFRLDLEDLRLSQIEQMTILKSDRGETRGLAALVGSYMGMMLLGVGESHITESWNTWDRSIQLSTRGLSTLNFVVTGDTSGLRRQSAHAVKEYFDSQ